VSGLRDGAGDADEREARNLGAMAMAGAMEPVVWRHPRGFLRQVALGCFQHLGAALNVRLQSDPCPQGCRMLAPPSLGENAIAFLVRAAIMIGAAAFCLAGW